MDGVVLINQNMVMAGQVTPGDTPGFPVTISKPGSYRLSSNLTVPTGANGVVVAADYVTIDLNGFSILGGAPGADQMGITDNGVARNGIVIRNGMVSGIQGIGLNLISSQVVIEDMQIFGCFLDGMHVGPCSIVKGNIIRGNQMNGIICKDHSSLSGNIVADNGNTGSGLGNCSVVSNNAVNCNEGCGIQVGINSMIRDNTICGNGKVGGAGLIVGSGSTVISNTVSGNGTDGIFATSPCTILGNTAIQNTKNNLALSGSGSTSMYNTA